MRQEKKLRYLRVALLVFGGIFVDSDMGSCSKQQRLRAVINSHGALFAYGGK